MDMNPLTGLNMATMDYKGLPSEFKALNGEEGVYEGHFSVTGNVDDGNDVIEPGAFKKTIRERGSRIKVLMAHDWSKIIGPPPDVLREDATGLYAKGRLTLASMWGREAWELMKDGAMTEASIGYQAIKSEYRDADGERVEGDEWDLMWRDDLVRHIKEIKLYEISPVPLGMNALANVRAVKAALMRGERLPLVGNLDSYCEAMARLTDSLRKGDGLVTATIEQRQKLAAALEEALELLLPEQGADESADEGDGDDDRPDPDKDEKAAAEPPVEDTEHLALRARMRAAALALEL